MHCHSATITDLEPATTYRYRVGSKALNVWSDYHTFTTAPANVDSFAFAYFGDTQAHPEAFGKMLNDVERQHPETAFYMIAGDLVEHGERRNLWDNFLNYTKPVFSTKPVAPAMGNHDFTRFGAGVRTFNAYFTLPFTQQVGSSSELNYSFQYGNTFFIVVNARAYNLKEQTDWLEAELKKAEAAGCDFKVIMSHFPVYNPKESRKNEAAKQYWAPLFDKYGVDLMFAGHDHSYMRSKPLIAGKVVPEGQAGTIYIVAVGSDKFYKAERLNIAAKQFTEITTYQIIHVSRNSAGEPALHYQAYGSDGKLLDEFELHKN